MNKSFHKRVREAIADPVLQEALDRNAVRRRESRRQAFQSLPQASRKIEQAGEIRRQILLDLDRYLDQLQTQLEANQFEVHRASDGQEAVRIIHRIAKQHQASLIAKSKSMVTEEIQLNQFLDQAGIRVVETDLGEFIVQLRGETPAHIITPAIHLLKEQVGRTFQEMLGTTYTNDVGRMTEIARDTLREVFQQAQIGICGVNFGIAESGSLCLVTNEGNGRMVTQLPPVLIAVMGMERLVRSWDDLDLMLQLLPRSATGQKLSSYVSILNQPSQIMGAAQPQERHLILLDNGRSALRDSPLRDALLCIRCGACLNVCPVFQEIGGHAYGSVYPGPIGSIISPGLFGMERYGHLATASSLCSACSEVCPVGIDFNRLLLRVRQEARKQPGHWKLKAGVTLFRWAATSPSRFRLAQRFASLATHWLPKRGGWIRRLPPPLAGWTRTRDVPPFQPRPKLTPDGRAKAPGQAPVLNLFAKEIRPQHSDELTEDPLIRFQKELERIDGEFHLCRTGDLGALIRTILGDAGCPSVMELDPRYPWAGEVRATLLRASIQLREHPLELPLDQRSREQAFQVYNQVGAGITGTKAGIADTGSIILDPESPWDSLASLLMPLHIAILASDTIYPSLREWLAGSAEAETKSDLIVISGPSRTADIEMTLTLGVHGPGRLVVLCVEDGGVMSK